MVLFDCFPLVFDLSQTWFHIFPVGEDFLLTAAASAALKIHLMVESEMILAVSTSNKMTQHTSSRCHTPQRNQTGDMTAHV